MPLDPETAKELTAQCRKALKKPMKFVYCASGADGEPVLVIDKNISPALKELKRTAKKKKFATGTVEKGEKGLTFLPQKDPGKLKQHLKNVFAKQVPLLKGAIILSTQDAEAEESEDAETSAPDAAQASRAAAPPPPAAAAPEQAASGAALKEQLTKSRDEIKTLAAELSALGDGAADESKVGKMRANLDRLKALRTQLVAQRASLQTS